MTTPPLRRAIVVGSTKEGMGWRNDLLRSLHGIRWPVVVHETEDYELASINWAREQYDEFVFLPQSTLVKDISLFDLCFGRWRGYSVNLGTAQGLRFRMYLGKYRSEALAHVGVPEAGNKDLAVQLENAWCGAYVEYEERAERLVDLGAPLEHSTHIEARHGRMNMRVENSYLIRYKGTVAPDPKDPPEVVEAIRWMNEHQGAAL